MRFIDPTTGADVADADVDTSHGGAPSRGRGRALAWRVLRAFGAAGRLRAHLEEALYLSSIFAPQLSAV
eukprot:462128-Prymnesium_polylepis.1